MSLLPSNLMVEIIHNDSMKTYIKRERKPSHLLGSLIDEDDLKFISILRLCLGLLNSMQPKRNRTCVSSNLL